MSGCFRHFTEKYRQTENQEQTASHESQCRTRVLTRVTDNIGVVAPSLLAAADIRGLILGLYDSGLTTQQLAKTALDLELLPTEKSALATQVIAHVLPDYKDGYTELHAACEDYITMHGAIGFVSDVVALGINVDLVGLQANGMSYV